MLSKQHAKPVHFINKDLIVKFPKTQTKRQSQCSEHHEGNFTIYKFLPATHLLFRSLIISSTLVLRWSLSFFLAFPLLLVLVTFSFLWVDTVFFLFSFSRKQVTKYFSQLHNYLCHYQLTLQNLQKSFLDLFLGILRTLWVRFVLFLDILRPIFFSVAVTIMFWANWSYMCLLNNFWMVIISIHQQVKCEGQQFFLGEKMKYW